jgi:hypothetical protein
MDNTLNMQESEDVFPVSTDLKENISDFSLGEKLNSRDIEDRAEPNGISELLASKAYDQIPHAVKQLLAKGQEFEQLIQPIVSTSGDHANNYAYWQCLGDIFAHENKLKDALSAYQKAEDILVKNLS